jgi:type II secretory pathway component GspD/PulD (secretin)
MIGDYSYNVPEKRMSQVSSKIKNIIKESELGANKEKIKGQNLEVQLINVALSDFIMSIYGKVLKIPFSCSSDVYSLNTRIDIVIEKKITHEKLKEVAKNTLNLVGVQVLERNGVTYISLPNGSGNTNYTTSNANGASSSVYNQQSQSKGYLDLDKKRVVYCRTLKNVDPVSLMVRLSSLIVAVYPEFIYHADTTNEYLFYSSYEENIDSISKIIKDSDLSDKQVFCEVQIIEVTHDGILTDGLAGYLSALKGSMTLSYTPLSSASDMNMFTLSLNPDVFNLIFGVLQNENIIKRIASPYLITRAGKTSSINVGDQIPVLQNTTLTTVGTTQNIVYKNTGVSLSLSPQIIGDNVYLDLDVTLSLGQINTLSTLNTPSISTREIHNSVIIKNNEALLLGGLYQFNGTFQNIGLPVKNEFIQNYINKNIREKSSTELVLYIRPVIIDNESNKNLLNENEIDMIRKLNNKNNEVVK